VSPAHDGYLADADLAPLWRTAHAAWCRNGGLRGQAIMRDLSERESLAIAGLVWRSPPWPAGATAKIALPTLQDPTR
jgi:hypothetical protein